MKALGGLETGEHGEGIGEVGGRGGGVGGSAHHLMMVVAVGDVGLLEKGAEGCLQEERPTLTLRTLEALAWQELVLCGNLMRLLL